MADVGVLEAIFLRSDSGHSAMPAPSSEAPEIAFLGKSNVGKSSLLNALMLKKGLVKTSKTPGHTQLLNQFGVTLKLRRSTTRLTLVDLPGYGFAKMPKAQHQKLGVMISGYLTQRQGLRALVHLFDLRHPPTQQDIDTWQQLSVLSPVAIAVGTKADRVPKSKQRAHANVIAKALGINGADVSIVSSETRQGRPELWSRILRAAYADASFLDDTNSDANDATTHA